MKIKSINLPSLTTAGDSFLYENESLTAVSLPSLTTAGVGSFAAINRKL